LFFLLRYLTATANAPVVGRVLCGVNYWWQNNQMIGDSVGKLIGVQVEKGFPVAFGPEYLRLKPGDKENLRAFVDTLPAQYLDLVTSALREVEKTTPDEKFLRSIGEFVSADELEEAVFETEQTSGAISDALAEIEQEKPRSMLLVGPSGVGKSAVRRFVGRALAGDGWRIFRTSGANLIAGKKYIGEIEGQVKNLLRNATVDKKIALYIDRFAELGDYGRSSSNDASVLDQIWPELESGRMLLIGESTPQGLQVLMRRYPSLPTTLKVMPLGPADEQTTRRIAGQLLEHLEPALAENVKRACSTKPCNSACSS
jgi:SpoVK/Ycf46/Vps4 family AAA+-type ATPase